MKTLNVSSIPLLTMMQKACETLVVVNMVEVSRIYNIHDRKLILAETQQANEMVDHIRELIKENESDSSNPKS